jgi:hypothetical protein
MATLGGTVGFENKLFQAFAHELAAPYTIGLLVDDRLQIWCQSLMLSTLLAA